MIVKRVIFMSQENLIAISKKMCDAGDKHWSNNDIESFLALYAEAGDTKTMNELATDDVVLDFDSGSEVEGGLPWIGLFKGKKDIAEVAQKIKAMKIKVLSRDYYLISETNNQLIVAAKDNIIFLDKIIVPNINFVNIITFRDDEIAYMMSDN